MEEINWKRIEKLKNIVISRIIGTTGGVQETQRDSFVSVWTIFIAKLNDLTERKGKNILVSFQ